MRFIVYLLIIVFISSCGPIFQNKGKDFVVVSDSTAVIINTKNTLQIKDTIIIFNRKIQGTRFISNEVQKGFSFFNFITSSRESIPTSYFFSKTKELKPIIDTTYNNANFLFINLDSLPKTEWLFHAWYIINRCQTLFDTSSTQNKNDSLPDTCLTHFRDLFRYLKSGESPLDSGDTVKPEIEYFEDSVGVILVRVNLNKENIAIFGKDSTKLFSSVENDTAIYFFYGLFKTCFPGEIAYTLAHFIGIRTSKNDFIDSIFRKYCCQVSIYKRWIIKLLGLNTKEFSFPSYRYYNLYPTVYHILIFKKKERSVMIWLALLLVVWISPFIVILINIRRIKSRIEETLRIPDFEHEIVDVVKGEAQKIIYHYNERESKFRKMVEDVGVELMATLKKLIKHQNEYLDSHLQKINDKLNEVYKIMSGFQSDISHRFTETLKRELSEQRKDLIKELKNLKSEIEGTISKIKNLEGDVGLLKLESILDIDEIKLVVRGTMKAEAEIEKNKDIYRLSKAIYDAIAEDVPLPEELVKLKEYYEVVTRIQNGELNDEIFKRLEDARKEVENFTKGVNLMIKILNDENIIEQSEIRKSIKTFIEKSGFEVRGDEWEGKSVSFGELKAWADPVDSEVSEVQENETVIIKRVRKWAILNKNGEVLRRAEVVVDTT